MAAVTAAVVVGAAAAYSADRQSSAAKDASKKEAEGVAAARQDTLEADQRARNIYNTGTFDAGLSSSPVVQQGSRPTGIPSSTGSVSNFPRTAQQNQLQQQFHTQPGGEVLPGANNQIPLAVNQPTTGGPLGAIPQSSQPGFGDPRQNYLQGIQSGLAFTDQGFNRAEGTLSPIASLAQPYLNEQRNLLGLGGQDAYQQSLSRVADPLQAEQERALLRNNAQLGGVGGNILSSLADQTRARTEANIGDRLGQLASASSPSLSALQNIANFRLDRDLRMGDITLGAGSDLSQMEQNRRQALVNFELGQGSDLAQLSQNMATARASRDVYASQNAPALAQGVMAGVKAYGGGA